MDNYKTEFKEALIVGAAHGGICYFRGNNGCMKTALLGSGSHIVGAKVANMTGMGEKPLVNAAMSAGLFVAGKKFLIPQAFAENENFLLDFLVSIGISYTVDKVVTNGSGIRMINQSDGNMVI